MKECLFHTFSDNWCAYCKFHSAGITVKQMRAKQCLKKQCNSLVRNQTHPYWKQRDAMKQKRKDRKQFINEYVKSVTGGNA